jgi:hypothetical protein
MRLWMILAPLFRSLPRAAASGATRAAALPMGMPIRAIEPFGSRKAFCISMTRMAVFWTFSMSDMVRSA